MPDSEIKPLLLCNQKFFQECLNFATRISVSFKCESGITLISGPRHSGKTSLLRQIACDLKGLKIYIDFEDSRFGELGSEIFQVIENTLVEIYEKEFKNNELGQTYYFLDEIQIVQGWDIWISKLHRQGAKVFMSSSSSNLAERELSIRFEGKSDLLKLFPFSFKEYLLMKYSVIPKPNSITPSLREEILCALLRYFENGGFPEVIKTGNVKLCQKYFEEILEKGDSVGLKSQDKNALKKIALYLISNMASEFSIETLKIVSGVEDKDIVNSYLEYLENNLLIFRVPKLNWPLENKENQTISHKVYIADTGFFKAVYPNYPDSLGLRFENLIFLELLRRGKNVFYFRNKRECDFIITEEDNSKVLAAIQTSLHLGSPAVREREILGLMEALEEYGLEEGIILTLDDEETIGVKGKAGKKTIVVKPAWKWMLE